MNDPAHAPLSPSAADKTGLFVAGVGLAALVVGIGCLASPFYLPGGVIGVLNGDRPMNQMGDRYLLHMIHSCASLVLGLFLCAAGAAAKFLGLGLFVGAAAAKSNAAFQPPPVVTKFNEHEDQEG